MTAPRALYLTYLGFIATLAVMIGVALHGLNHLQQINHDLYQHPFTVTNAVMRVNVNSLRMQRALRDIMLAKTPDEITAANSEIEAAVREIQTDLPTVRERFLGPPAMVDRIERGLKAWLPYRDQVVALKQQGQDAAIRELRLGIGTHRLGELRSSIRELRTWAEKRAEAFNQQATESAQRLRVTFIVVSVLMLLGSFWLAYLGIRNHHRAKDAAAYNTSILDNILDAIISIDEVGKVVTFTPAAERMFGYRADEVIGQNIKMLMPPPFRDAHDGYLANYRETGQARIIGSGREVEAQRKDGSRFPIDLAVSEMRVAEGRRFVGLVRDISARKAMESDLMAARDAAEAANRAKSQFLANMSHEIRTPMNAILGLTRLVLDSELTPEQRDQLEKVTKSGRAMVSIINDILDFSRLEAGRITLEQAPVRLEALLLESADLFSALVAEKGLELFIDIGPDTPLMIQGDALRLGQVLSNLIGNAVKFTFRGEIRVSVRAVRYGDDDVTLRVSVRDTGIGIPSEAMGKLFQSFSQADSSTTRVFGGSGLGLAICDRLLQLMGGRIEIDSAQGRGTEVSFTLVAGLVTDERREFSHLGQDLQQLHGKRVLVVDDQATARMILVRMLQAWGLAASEARGGQEAIDMAVQAARAGQPFYGLVVDRRMPGLDGLETLRRIREQLAAESLPQPTRSVLVTGYEKSGPDEALARLDAVLAKPVVPSHLMDALLHGRPSPTRDRVAAASQRFDGMRVLLAEDNELNQEVAAGFLRRRGVTVSVAANGAEAVEQAQLFPFDLVLMDLHMPVMGGIEATAAIRQLPLGQDLPIVAMTAAVLAEDRDRCTAAGMVDFIAKPVEPEDLLRVLALYGSGGVMTAAPAEVTTATPTDATPPLLDLAAGLRRLDGDQALQHRLLLGFVERWSDVVRQLDDLLASRETEQAIDLVHTLKGVAANLGAPRLADVARTVNDALREKMDEAMHTASREALAATLADTLAAIQAALIGADTPPVDAAQPVGELHDDLRALRPFVARQEVADDDLLARLRQYAASAAPEAAPVGKLIRHLDEFEHAAAIACLDALLKEGNAP